MKTHTKTLLTALTASAMLAGSAHAELITNGDFESPDFTGDAQTPTFTDWVYAGSGALAGDEDDAGRVPGTNPNQVARFQNNSNGLLAQDVSHNWSALDIFDLSFNASETWWREGSAGDEISVSIYQLTGSEMDLAGSETDDVALWTSGVIDLDGTHTGSAMPAWTAGQTFNYSIDASTDFSGGTAGEAIYLQFKWEDGGTSVAYLDNVSLTVIPEPGSLALLGLGGILIASRRRRA